MEEGLGKGPGKGKRKGTQTDAGDDRKERRSEGGCRKQKQHTATLLNTSRAAETGNAHISCRIAKIDDG